LGFNDINILCRQVTGGLARYYTYFLKKMNLEDLSKAALEEKFEVFLFNMADCLEQLEAKCLEQGYNFDYSFNSLPFVEKYIIDNQISVESDDYNDVSSYTGEVVRKNVQGSKWICNLDKKYNSIYYGYPVITGHTKVEGVLFSPFHTIRNFIKTHKTNLLQDAIECQINPQPIDWSKFSTKK
jgi:hypothetical protein